MSKSMIATAEPTDVTTVETVVETTEPTQTDIENSLSTDASEPSADMVFGKFKDMDAAQEGYKHLESENGRLRREKSPEAPEKYEFDFSESEDLKDIYGDYDFAADPLFQALEPAFKNSGLTQEQANAIVTEFGKFQKSNMVDFDGELTKLGPDGASKIAEVESFVQKNYSTEDQAILVSIATTAEGINFIKNNMMAQKSIPGGDVNTVTESSAEMFAKAMEIKNGNSNFLYDMSAQSRYEAIMDKAVGLQTKGL